jgi:uncharacterized protein (DUF433 family)
MNARISISPAICHGKPVITGTRVLVTNILGALAAGDTIEQVLEDYHIKREDVFAALQFGSQLCNFETLPYESLAE